MILLSLKFSLCEGPYIRSGIVLLFWHLSPHVFHMIFSLNNTEFFHMAHKTTCKSVLLNLMPLANLLCTVAIRMCHSAT